MIIDYPFLDGMAIRITKSTVLYCTVISNVAATIFGSQEETASGDLMTGRNVSRLALLCVLQASLVESVFGLSGWRLLYPEWARSTANTLYKTSG